jgi:AcrR family transcriptional regulator
MKQHVPRDRGPIWTYPEPGSRQPRLTRQQIAASALAIADAEGFGAVSMRRVATDLGVGTMSLYHYLRTKDDLVALMDDAIMAESLIPDAELPADWRAALTAIARRTRAVFLRHPWALHALQGEAAVPGAPVSPNSMRHFEQSLAAVEHAPLDTRGKLELLSAVDDYVFGHVLRAGEVRKRTEAGGHPAEAVMEFAMAQLRSGHYPQLEALSRDPAVTALTAREGLEDRFERGLLMLLDGAAMRIGPPGG